MIRSPLKAKRAKPRRQAPERITQVRQKRKRGDRTAEEARHIARVAGLPCIITGRAIVQVHHLLRAPGKRAGRDHRWVIPISPLLHTDGNAAIHRLGSEAAFEREWGLPEGYLIEQAARLWEESENG